MTTELVIEDVPGPSERISNPRKKKKNDDSEKFLNAIVNMSTAPPESPPLKQFFSSLASTASAWSRKKQAMLEMKCLQIMHEIEFADE